MFPLNYSGSHDDVPFNTDTLGKPLKKSFSLNGRPLRGGGVKGRAIKEKRTFFRTFFPISTAIKLEGG